MKFLSWGKDGGKDSTVSGFWIVEIKSLFSIVVLKFNEGSRENYHSHAFNAWTWFLKGETIEKTLSGSLRGRSAKLCRPSIIPKFTPKAQIHKHVAKKNTWAISIRGPWEKSWIEVNTRKKEIILLENGRHEVGRAKYE